MGSHIYYIKEIKCELRILCQAKLTFKYKRHRETVINMGDSENIIAMSPS